MDLLISDKICNKCLKQITTSSVQIPIFVKHESWGKMVKFSDAYITYCPECFGEIDKLMAELGVKEGDVNDKD